MSLPSPDSPIIIWCHSCRRIARDVARPDPLCPSCSSAFVEEIGDPAFLLITGLRSNNDDYNFSDVRSRISRVRRLFTGFFRSYGRIPFFRRNNRSEASSPLDQELGLIEMDASQNPSRPLLGRGHSRSDHGSRADVGNEILARRIWDAVLQRFSSGLIISDRPGSRPASKAAVAAMPTITISKENLPLYAGDDSEEVLDECAICKEAFEIGGEVKEMPCKHIYHPECILPWLELHSSCPLCRSEMPADEEHTSSSSSSNEATAATSGGDRAIIVIGISSSGAHLFSFIVLGLGSRNDFNHLDREQASVVDHHQVTDDESVNNNNGVVAGGENAPSDETEEQVTTDEHLVGAESSHGDSLSQEREKVAVGENSSDNEHIDIRRDVLNETGIFPGMLDAENLSSASSSTETATQNSGNMDVNRRNRSFFSWIYRHATSSRSVASSSMQDHFSSWNGEGTTSDARMRRGNSSTSP